MKTINALVARTLGLGGYIKPVASVDVPLDFFHQDKILLEQETKRVGKEFPNIEYVEVRRINQKRAGFLYYEKVPRKERIANLRIVYSGRIDG